MLLRPRVPARLVLPIDRLRLRSREGRAALTLYAQGRPVHGTGGWGVGTRAMMPDVRRGRRRGHGDLLPGPVPAARVVARPILMAVHDVRCDSARAAMVFVTMSRRPPPAKTRDRISRAAFFSSEKATSAASKAVSVPSSAATLPNSMKRSRAVRRRGGADGPRADGAARPRTGAFTGRRNRDDLMALLFHPFHLVGSAAVSGHDVALFAQHASATA